MLCNRCQQTLVVAGECKNCGGVYLTKVREATDLHETFKGLRAGEEIHIEMNEDQYSGKQWEVTKPLHTSFRLKLKGPFVQNPQDGQYGTRTFVFEVVGSGSGNIELHEVQRVWSWFSTISSSTAPVVGGKQFNCVFQIK
jgi:predicted secreted protein